MSSRIIVKGLPKKISKERLQDHFSKFGQVTDIRLVHTQSGVFRRFAFIGFVNESQAKKATDYFHYTFIDSCKIEVEPAKPYGDKEIPRPWSRYSKGSSNFETKEDAKEEFITSTEEGKEKQEELKKEKKQRLNQDIHKSKLTSLLGEFYELESDPQFAEFLAAHKPKSTTHVWTNDEEVSVKREIRKQRVKPSITSVEAKRPGGKGILLTRTHLKFDEGMDKGTEVEEDEESIPRCHSDHNTADTLSDMEYLKSKVIKSDILDEEEDDSDIEDNKIEEDTSNQIEEMEEDDKPQVTSFTLKMRGIPFKAKEEDVHAFFYPLKLSAVRIVLDSNDKPTGVAFVDFLNEPDMMDGLRRNRDCMGRRYIELFRDECLSKEEDIVKKPRPWEKKESTEDGEDESIGESGRLFVRNLSYSISEDDLTKLFEKYGPLTEVHLPLDRNTSKPIGLAFITYMLPEHAVKAYTELDGQIFQGRLLHLLPAKPRVVTNKQETSSKSSYKKSNESKLRSQAGSDRNWNTLFLGSNAVIDSMVDKYSVEKRDLLDPDTNSSLAVRMALGETQLVSETKEFLESEGVMLDIFQQVKPKRSKTVVLVKNLAYGTTTEELHNLFSPFGSLSRVILPPGGISALVEFSEPSKARSAFKKLAYSEFKHIPLYLEWAPVGVLCKGGNKSMKHGFEAETKTMKHGSGAETKTEETAEEKSSEMNDGAMIFVKNLNFSTTDDALRQVFSKIGTVKKANIARKVNMKDPNKPLSMGYGFVEFETHKDAMKAIKNLQNYELEGHRLELKLSHQETRSQTQERKKARDLEQRSAKILVRNIPFEAARSEVKQLFSTFGELKHVRLPKKMNSSREHRGFGFVEFVTKEEARRAFDSLSQSTHFYGRRLVLEWAEEEETIEDIRKRTTRYFMGDNQNGVVKRRKQLAADLLSTLQKTDDQILN